MEVLLPMSVSNCEGDCRFWENDDNGKQMCSFNWEVWKEIPAQGIPTWCPLRKFEVKE